MLSQYFDYASSDDSDLEDAYSSEDDVEVLLNGTVKQKKRLCRRRAEKASSDEDDFEDEMKDELNQMMKNIEKNHGTSGTGPDANSEMQTAAAADETPAFYDNLYFDSDSDDEGHSEEKKSRKRPVLTNDELFYDPKMDDSDQLWVDRMRRSYQVKSDKSSSAVEPTKGGQQTSTKPRPLPTSDAVLNCPACMCLLCLDCQRHESYRHQYRAMFVMNCTPDMTEVLHFAVTDDFKAKSAKNTKKRKRHRDKFQLQENSVAETEGNADTRVENGEEFYHPVQCDHCKTEVAVYDKDEVYHFFNVLASY